MATTPTPAGVPVITSIPLSPDELEFHNQEQKYVETFKATFDTGALLNALRIVWDWVNLKKLEKAFVEEKDLVSESEVDLGEGIIEDRDYPDPLYESICKEEEEGLEDTINRLPPHLKKIVQLPYDQVPAEYRGWRREYRPCRSREEEALYRHVLLKTDGCEVPQFRDRNHNFGDMCAFSYKYVHGTLKQELEGYCKQAIDKYNEEKGTGYKLKYLIKMCGDIYEYNITFALTDPNHRPYVGRVHADFPVAETVPVLLPMRVTIGEYRAPKWKDVNNQEHICEVNEGYRKKLLELERSWKQKMQNYEEYRERRWKQKTSFK